MLSRLAAAAGLVLLSAWSVGRVARPPRPVPATAPDTVFSAERALRHVEQIAVRPHAIGMPDHDRVRDYIAGQLTALGLRPQIQVATAVGTRYQQAGRVQNILAWIPGRDAQGKAVLLMAHYDGVEAGPSAADDGAGTAAVLETVRALRARPTPLAHDVIVLITDGEEAGLLGAAAFVREHPWAKDVAFVLDFEARGTSGRSFMFETGPGNLDAARVLRRAGDVSAGSVFTTIYRTMPNDTDLSELAVLGLPALNFAFADGVERYHTSHDDLAHLNPGSVQHHGAQMLALARELASDSLPRPVTGDAVFFDLPVVGLVLYPESAAVPIAVVALVLVAVVAFRERKGVLVGMIAAVLTVTIAAIAARLAAILVSPVQAALPWGGSAQWSGVHASAIALFVVAITLGCLALARRWSSDRGLAAGAMVVWAVLALLLSIKAPGASYLFAWPVMFAAVAALVPRWNQAAEWVAAAITLFILAGFAYGVSVVMLGVGAVGALVLGVVTSLVTLLLAPTIARVTADAPWWGARLAGAASVAVVVVGLFVVRRGPDHPVPTALVFTQNADSSDAWFGSFARFRDAWTRAAIGQTTDVPAWTGRLTTSRRPFAGHRVPRAALGAPNAVLVRDTLLNGARRVVFRVTAPPGTTGLLMRASGAHVSTASIDGRIVDTTRYRSHASDWVMEYSAVPDSGAIVALSIPAGASIDLELTARRPGVPVPVPARPNDVVPVQTGDVSYVYKRLRF